MNCRQAEIHIFSERDGLLDPVQNAALAEHVAQCATCRRTRAMMAAAIESWRGSHQSVVPPDPEREWTALRRVLRGGVHPGGRVSPARRLAPWLALPIGAAAVVALTLSLHQPSLSPAGKNVAQAQAVEVSAADGSVVFVDDKSGWVVIWEAEAAPKTI